MPTSSCPACGVVMAKRIGRCPSCRAWLGRRPVAVGLVTGCLSDDRHLCGRIIGGRCLTSRSGLGMADTLEVDFRDSRDATIHLRPMRKADNDLDTATGFRFERNRGCVRPSRTSLSGRCDGRDEGRRFLRSVVYPASRHRSATLMGFSKRASGWRSSTSRTW